MKNFIKIFLLIMSISFSFPLFNNLTFAAANYSNIKKTTNSKKIDYDLTNLSQTVLYSQLKNMQSDYKKYIGKTIKYQGIMRIVDTDTNTYYMAMCSDGPACCSAGFEFVLKDNQKNNYPNENSKILITGELGEYTEDNLTYLHLINSSVEIVK